MKRNTKFTFIFLILYCTMSAQEIRVISYNIRFDNPADAPHNWTNRSSLIFEQIARFHPDVIGLQEVLHHQLLDFKSNLKSYESVGIGRDDGKQAGEYSPILFDSTRWLLKEHGHFWLSDKPHRPNKGWDAALPRIATWVILQEKQNQNLLLFLNTHFDHVGQEARVNSAIQIAQFIKQQSREDMQTIVVGDFNISPTNEAYTIFSKESGLIDTHEVTKVKKGPTGTFNAFQYDHKSPRIDYVWVDTSFSVISYEVWQESFNGILPSDHWPVLIRLK